MAYDGSDPLPDRPARDDPGARLATEKDKRRYLPLQDDIASVAYWYQTLPTAPFPRCRTATISKLSRYGSDGATPTDYPERAYAAVLGKLIGVYLGRPFEGGPISGS